MSLPPDAREIDIPDLDEFEEGFSQAQQSLDSLLEGRLPEPSDEDPSTEEPSESESSEEAELGAVRGEGQAADGRVQAAVKLGGELAAVVIDPRALHAGPQALGEHLAEAINAALDDLTVQAQTRAASPPVDPARLAEELTAAQDLAAERAAMFTEGLDTALHKIRRAAEERW